jgi:hypothetical protein
MGEPNALLSDRFERLPPLNGVVENANYPLSFAFFAVQKFALRLKVMEWMPPPDGIEMCQAGVVSQTRNRGEGNGNSFNHWTGFGKAQFSGARVVS